MDSREQRLLDEEHLRLLRLGYLVAGGASVFFAFFPLFYVAMGVFVATGGFNGTSHRTGEPDPRLMGWIFVSIGIVIFIFAVLIAVLKFLTARALGRRRSRMLCLVTAGISCLGIPYGTVLAIFTFIVLSRPGVIALFDAVAASGPVTASPPPPAPND
jgi:hypothetical protein